MSQELKQANEVIITKKGITHTLNKHEGFNKLLPMLCKHGDLLNTKQSYTLEYDGDYSKNPRTGKPTLNSTWETYSIGALGLGLEADCGYSIPLFNFGY